MKILLLADCNSSHVVKWAIALSENMYKVHIFSLHIPEEKIYENYPGILISSLNLSEKNKFKSNNKFSKLIYLRAINKIKLLIKEIEPDIIHAHYASSYGFLGALTKFHPFILSVWGADIYNFPNHSFIHKSIIKYNLYKADVILSTSKIMKEETKKYTSKSIEVTPFGIDTEKFVPKNVATLFKDGSIVIGTIKALEIKYGVEYLIKAFHLLKNKFNNKKIKLLIVGKGTQENKLKGLVKQLDLEEDTLFTGYINPAEVEKYQNMLDISVSFSVDNSESFGVAVLEACSCGKPVVVSNVGGLSEVVEDGKTGFIVEAKNYFALADKINYLIKNPDKRIELGKNGRERVFKYYDWNESVNKMFRIYNSFIIK